MSLIRTKYKKIYPFIYGFITDKNKKSFFQMLIDLIDLKKTNSFTDLSYYFNALMYKKDAGDIGKYVNRNILLKINNLHGIQGTHYYLDNKIRFAEKMTEAGVPIPLYIGKIEKQNFYESNGNKTELKIKSDLLPIIAKLLEHHKVIFIKNVTGLGGDGVFKFKLETLIDLSVLNLEHDYMIDKGLEQHHDLNLINPYCINTLRVITLNDKGDIRIPNSILRMGVNKAHVDNATFGGIFLNYDLSDNKLYEIAKRFAAQGGKSFYRHPDTDFLFKDQSLPYPDKVIELVLQAAQVFPDRSVIGWDVAFTSEGPVIIEGNSNPCPLLTQVSLKGFRNNAIYEEFYREVYQ